MAIGRLLVSYRVTNRRLCDPTYHQVYETLKYNDTKITSNLRYDSITSHHINRLCLDVFHGRLHACDIYWSLRRAKLSATCRRRLRLATRQRQRPSDCATNTQPGRHLIVDVEQGSIRAPPADDSEPRWQLQ